MICPRSSFLTEVKLVSLVRCVIYFDASNNITMDSVYIHVVIIKILPVILGGYLVICYAISEGNCLCSILFFHIPYLLTHGLEVMTSDTMQHDYFKKTQYSLFP